MRTSKILYLTFILFWINHSSLFAQSFLQVDITVENQEIKNQIEGKLKQYASETNVSIFTYLIEDTQGEPLATYARLLANDLGITPKSSDSTILIVISADVKKGYIKSSGGLRHLLTRTVLREMIATNPYLEEGKFLEATDVLTNDLILTIHPYFEVSDISLDDTEDFSENSDDFDSEILDESETENSSKNNDKKGRSLASYLMWTMGLMAIGILAYAAYYFYVLNNDNMQENMTLDSFGTISGNKTASQEFEELDLENFQGGGVEGSW